MTLFQKIKYLCSKKKLSVATLERELGFANGSLRRWDNISPAADKVKKVADYFSVSMDYLLSDSNNHHSENAVSSIDENVRALAREIQSLNPGNQALLKDLITTMRKRGEEALKGGK